MKYWISKKETPSKATYQNSSIMGCVRRIFRLPVLILLLTIHEVVLSPVAQQGSDGPGGFEDVDEVNIQVVIEPRLNPRPSPHPVIINHPQKGRQPIKVVKTVKKLSNGDKFFPDVKTAVASEIPKPLEDSSRTERNILTTTSQPSSPSIKSRSPSVNNDNVATSRTSKETKVPIIRNSKTESQNEDRSYQFDFESGNGIHREEKGFLKNPGSKTPAQVMSGSYSYTGPDGNIYTITYIADENGFRAEGSHLPVAPFG